MPVEALVKKLGAATVAVFALIAFNAGSVSANWHGHGYYGWHGGWSFSFGLGPWWGYGYPYAYSYPYPYAYPYAYPYSYPYTYSYPYAAAPAPPAAAPPAPQATWYYCRAKKAYYPYVSTCPKGWEQVPAQPAQ